METTEQRTMGIQDFDITTKETINIEVPEKSQKVVLTITKRHYFDPKKNKIVSDQVVHRAKYRVGRKMKKNKGDTE